MPSGLRCRVLITKSVIFLTAIVAIVIVLLDIRKHRLPAGLQWFAGFLIIGAVFESVAIILKARGANTIVFHIYTLVELFVIVIALSEFQNRRLRAKRIAILAAYLIIWVILKLSGVEPLGQVEKLSIILSSIVIMILCYQTTQDLAPRMRSMDPLMIGIVSIGAYHAGLIAVYIFYPEYRPIWNVQLIFNIIERIAVCSAIVLTYRSVK